MSFHLKRPRERLFSRNIKLAEIITIVNESQNHTDVVSLNTFSKKTPTYNFFLLLAKCTEEQLYIETLFRNTSDISRYPLYFKCMENAQAYFSNCRYCVYLAFRCVAVYSIYIRISLNEGK